MANLRIGGLLLLLDLLTSPGKYVAKTKTMGNITISVCKTPYRTL